MKFVLSRFAGIASRRLAVLVPVAGLLFASLAATGLAQDQPPPINTPRDGAIVRAIDIKYAGPVTVSRERILSNMRTTIGQPFSQAGLEEDIRNVYQTGDVTNVRIFGEPMTGGVRVIVIVQSRDVIKEIVLEGVTVFKPKKVMRVITAKSGNALNEEQLEVDRQKILDLYRSKGFNNVEVQFRVSRDEAAGNAVVYFSVNEGGKAQLHAIVFEGNYHIKAKVLRKAMKNTKPKTIFSFLTKDGRLDPQKMKEDLEDVREVYQNKGYIDMEITQTRIETDSRGRTTLYIYIKEGDQYRISKLTIKGNTVLTDQQLRLFLKMKENSLYTPKGLKDDVKVFTDFYGSRGYVDLQIRTDAVPGGKGLVDLTYTVDEGIVSFVERINIEGNSITKDKVIRRELALAPGDIYAVPFADASKKRLENLNYFSKVEINPTDTLVPGRKDMNVIVEEKRTGELSFGAGFSSIDKLVGQATLTQGNFDILNFPAFTGGGQKFRLSLVYGQTRKDAVITLTEPYFLDSRFSVTFEAFYHNTNYTNDPYTQQNLGGAIAFRRPLTRYLSVRGEYRLEEIKISNPTNVVFAQDTGSRSRSAFASGLVYDSRDSVFLTRSGTRVDVGGFIAGGPLGGQTQIYGWSIEAAHYIPLPYDMILTLYGRVSTVSTLKGGEIYHNPPPGSETVPIEDRTFLGGANDLRGYDYRFVGPKDPQNNPLGGRSIQRATVELTFPIIERVRGAVFYDGGVNHLASYSFGFQNYSSDYGLGLRLDLPIGPIRIDYAFPIQINKQYYNNPEFPQKQAPFMNRSGRFNFNVGYQF